MTLNVFLQALEWVDICIVESGQCLGACNTQRCGVSQWEATLLNQTFAEHPLTLKYYLNSATLHFLTYKMHLQSILFNFFRKGKRGRGRTKERISSRLTEPDAGLDPITWRSRPQWKSRVSCLSNWATKAPQNALNNST